jgi:LysR family transcriptional regulator, nitrogen assimilation regulatory protein
LTEAGKVLLCRSEELFERISNIRAELAKLVDDLSGVVRIGGASSISEILFAPLADRIHQEMPNVQLSTTESGCRLPVLLEEGAIDLAVLSCPWRVEGRGWESHPMIGEGVYLVGQREASDIKPKVTVARVLALPLILSPPPNAQRLKLAYEAQRRGTTINVVAESESVHGQAALVRRGLGFAVLPYSAAKLMEAEHDVVMCSISGFYTWRTILWRTGRCTTRVETKVLTMIGREMERLAESGAFGPQVRAALPAVPKGNPFPDLVRPNRHERRRVGS